MRGLESLYLSYLLVHGDSLKCLSALTHLKMLGLEDAHAEGKPLLAHLPTLPRLERLDLTSSDVNDDDVHKIIAQPRLKALNLSYMDVTGEGLARLASCKSLEELVADDNTVSAAPNSLMIFKRLKVLHIPGNIALDFPEIEFAGDEDARRVRDAADAIRRSNPGIVIRSGSELTILPYTVRWEDLHHGREPGGGAELAR